MLFSGTDMTQSFVGLRTFPPSDSVGLIYGSLVPNNHSLSADTNRDPNPIIPTCANISFCSNYLYSIGIEPICYHVVQKGYITPSLRQAAIYM